MKIIEIDDKLTESVSAALHELLLRLKEDRAQLDTKITRIESDLAAIKKSSSTKPDQDSRPRRPRGSNKEQIRALFQAEKSLSISTTALAARLGLASSSTGRALQQLADEGFLEQTRDGSWHAKQKTSPDQ